MERLSNNLITSTGRVLQKEKGGIWRHGWVQDMSITDLTRLVVDAIIHRFLCSRGSIENLWDEPALPMSAWIILLRRIRSLL